MGLRKMKRMACPGRGGGGEAQRSAGTKGPSGFTPRWKAHLQRRKQPGRLQHHGGPTRDRQPRLTPRPLEPLTSPPTSLDLLGPASRRVGSLGPAWGMRGACRAGPGWLARLQVQGRRHPGPAFGSAKATSSAPSRSQSPAPPPPPTRVSMLGVRVFHAPPPPSPQSLNA